MKGGFNNPPNRDLNLHRICEFRASMKGGFNNPPNMAPPGTTPPGGASFNEGGVQ